MKFLAALLVTGLAVWPLVYLLRPGARTRGDRPRRLLIVFMAWNALLPAAYLALSALDYHWSLLQDVQASVALVTGEIDPARQLAELNQQRDRHRGYRAGYALATDDQHRGSKVPNSKALAAIARVRGKGQSADFQEGFRGGYVAGLTGGESAARQDDLSRR